MLVHLVDGTQQDVAEAYKVVRREVGAYGAGLVEKPELVALTKSDALGTEDRAEKRDLLAAASGADVAVISAVSGDGIAQLLDALLARIEAETAPEEAPGVFAP